MLYPTRVPYELDEYFFELYVFLLLFVMICIFVIACDFRVCYACQFGGRLAGQSEPNICVPLAVGTYEVVAVDGQ